MAYQVEYEFSKMKVEKVKKRTAVFYIFAALGLSAALIAANTGGGIVHTLLMGKGENTKIAANHMIESLEEGMPLEDAINAFCAELKE